MATVSRIVTALLLCGILAAPAIEAQTRAATKRDPESQFRLAVSNFQSGRYEAAAGELENLARTMPPSFEVEELLGLVYSAEKKATDANRAFQKAVLIKPDSAPARANLAVSFASLGKPSQAEAEFRRAIQMAPDDYEANRDFGQFYVREGKIEAAIPFLAKAQRLRPSSYNNGYNLALAYDKAGQFKEARQQLVQLLSIKRTAELYDLLGEVDEKSGNFVDAANDYQRAAHLDPSEQYIFDWGSEFLLHHTWNPAITVFSDGVKRFPNSAPLAIGLGLALYWRGDYKPAVKALMHATDLAPSDPHTYYFLTKAYQRTPGEMDEVTARFRRFEQLRPNDPQAAYDYAMSLWKGTEAAATHPDLQPVEALLKKAESLDPSLAEAHLELGNLYSHQRRYAEAVPEYQRALKLNPKLTDGYYRLGQAYVHLGKKALADQEFVLHQKLYTQHLAESDRVREEIRQFVYSTRQGQADPKHAQ